MMRPRAKISGIKINYEFFCGRLCAIATRRAIMLKTWYKNCNFRIRLNGIYSVVSYMIKILISWSIKLNSSPRAAWSPKSGPKMKLLFYLGSLSKKFSYFRSQEIKNKWNEIAKCLFMKSDKMYFRTPKQCR